MLAKVLYCMVFISFGTMYSSWAEDTLHTMSLEQKISQLLFPSFYINNTNDVERIKLLLQTNTFGGILLLNDRGAKRCNPLQQAELVSELQQMVNIPLLVTQDCEWGLSMRLDDVVPFPRNANLAHHDDELLYEFGKEIGRQCKLVGVHVNFAPVVDVNCNPANPIINTRSFGDTVEIVVQKAVPVIRGMQDAGIITCAKHFPGHGDTDVDSHKQLPIITHDIDRLTEVELAPFKAMIDAGVDMIMVGHLLVPAFDSQLPASLSHVITTKLLRQEYGFDGIVCTDGLRMKAVSTQYSSAELALLAFKAGNDILLEVSDPEQALIALVEAVNAGIIDEYEIDQRVLKILHCKQKLGLHECAYEPLIDVELLNTECAQKLSEQLYS